MEDAANTFKAAGIQVVISSQTPPNPFRDHTGATPVYALYARAVAEKTGVAFVDHFSLTQDEYLGLGAAAVNGMLPSDGIHTTLAGAEVVVRSFIRGVVCGGPVNPLYGHVAMDAMRVSSFPLFGQGYSTDTRLWRPQEISKLKGGMFCKGGPSLKVNPFVV